METPRRSNAQTDGYCMYEMFSNIITNLTPAHAEILSNWPNVRPDSSEVAKGNPPEIDTVVICTSGISFLAAERQRRSKLFCRRFVNAAVTNVLHRPVVCSVTS